MQCDQRKVSIIGLGNVGVTAAYALLLRGLADQVVLVSRSLEKAKGEQLDLEHGLAFLDQAQVLATDRYEDIAGSDVVIVTAGVAQAEGESRLDLTNRNLAIVNEIIPKIVQHSPESVIVMVTNPVDVLTHQAIKLAGLPAGQVFGSGTLLDTARFRIHLAQQLGVHPRSMHAYILGEHGDSSFPMVDSATIGGQPLTTFPGYTPEKMQAAFTQAQQAAYQIIQAKGATYYAIGVVITKLVSTIMHNQRSVLPVSTTLTDYYGESDVTLSVPCIVGKSGIQHVLTTKLSESEQAAFHHSCEVVRSAIQTAQQPPAPQPGA